MADHVRRTRTARGANGRSDERARSEIGGPRMRAIRGRCGGLKSPPYTIFMGSSLIFRAYNHTVCRTAVRLMKMGSIPPKAFICRPLP